VPLKFKVNRSEFFENSDDNLNNFSDYVTYQMQNISLLVKNNTKFSEEIRTKNASDIYLAFSFNQEDSRITGNIMDSYSNQGYVINMDYNQISSTLYNEISRLVLKDLIFLENLRVVHVKNIVYFKKFDLFIKADFFFEFGALGVTKKKMEFILVDFSSEVKIFFQFF
jgi:hypothetical protein